MEDDISLDQRAEDLEEDDLVEAAVGDGMEIEDEDDLDDDEIEEDSYEDDDEDLI